jgi:hypothetical protein
LCISASSSAGFKLETLAISAHLPIFETQGYPSSVTLALMTSPGIGPHLAHLTFCHVTHTVCCPSSIAGPGLKVAARVLKSTQVSNHWLATILLSLCPLLSGDCNDNFKGI